MISGVTYHEAYEVLRNVYLEDSYVLNIIEEADSVAFEMEFVLTEGHSLYHSPKPSEQYCYRKGRLQFLSCASAELKLSNQRPSTDANGETDLGNIDTFEKVSETHVLQGCWGKLEVNCNKLEIEFDDRENSS